MECCYCVENESPKKLRKTNYQKLVDEWKPVTDGVERKTLNASVTKAGTIPLVSSCSLCLSAHAVPFGSRNGIMESCNLQLTPQCNAKVQSSQNATKSAAMSCVSRNGLQDYDENNFRWNAMSFDLEYEKPLIVFLKYNIPYKTRDGLQVCDHKKEGNREAAGQRIESMPASLHQTISILNGLRYGEIKQEESRKTRRDREGGKTRQSITKHKEVRQSSFNHEKRDGLQGRNAKQEETRMFGRFKKGEGARREPSRADWKPREVLQESISESTLDEQNADLILHEKKRTESALESQNPTITVQGRENVNQDPEVMLQKGEQTEPTLKGQNPKISLQDEGSRMESAPTDQTNVCNVSEDVKESMNASSGYDGNNLDETPAMSLVSGSQDTYPCHQPNVIPCLKLSEFGNLDRELVMKCIPEHLSSKKYAEVFDRINCEPQNGMQEHTTKKSEAQPAKRANTAPKESRNGMQNRYHFILSDRPQFGECPPNKITATTARDKGKQAFLCNNPCPQTWETGLDCQHPGNTKKSAHGSPSSQGSKNKVVVCMPCPEKARKKPCSPCIDEHHNTERSDDEIKHRSAKHPCQPPVPTNCPFLKLLPASANCPSQKRLIEPCQAQRRQPAGDHCPVQKKKEQQKKADCSPCMGDGDGYLIAKDYRSYKLASKPRQKDYLYRCDSRELLGSRLLKYCLCVRRNGLQDECPRTACKGRPACLVKPWPNCWPSGGCHGLDYDRPKGIERVNPTLQYRMDNKECGPWDD